MLIFGVNIFCFLWGPLHAAHVLFPACTVLQGDDCNVSGQGANPAPYRRAAAPTFFLQACTHFGLHLQACVGRFAAFR
jgi:hypothetical protein